MAICLLPEMVEKFKEALREKHTDLAGLMNLDHADLVERLKPYAGDNAGQVATLLEEKLILKNRTLGLQNALNKLTGSGKSSPERIAENKRIVSEFRAKQQERIFSPSEHQSYLGGIVDKKLGFSVSKEVAAKVGQLSQKAAETKDAPTTNLSGVSIEHVQAVKDLRAYIESQKPVSAGSTLFKNLAITGRNLKLTNPSTPTKTIIGQTVSGLTEKIALRVSTLSLKGASRDLVGQAYKEAQQTWSKTRLDTTSANGTLGEGHFYDLPSGLKSTNPIMRGVSSVASFAAKWSTKVAIDLEHSVVMTKFHQRSFFDAANILSTKFAKGDKVAAREMFKDAVRINPKTEEGAIVRLEAQKHAARVIGTNSPWTTKLLTEFRNGLDKYLYNGLGTLATPIVKIPTSLITNGIENSGAGIFGGLKDIFQGQRKIQSPVAEIRNEGMAQFANGLKRASRTLGVMGVAAWIVNGMSPQDFKIDKYGGTYVRIGGVWVNQEFFNVVGPAISAQMELKKSRSSIFSAKGAEAYVSGAAQGLRNLPVISEANKIITDLATGSGKQIGPYLATFGIGFVDPAIVKHALSANPIKELFFSTSGLPDAKELKKLGAK